MALKYNSDTVDHIIKDGQYARELVYNGDIVWEEKYGTLKIGQYPKGIGSIECRRTSMEPNAPVHDYDEIFDGEILYNGDELKVIVEPEDYWSDEGNHNITCTTPDVSSYLSNAASRETTLDIIAELGICATRDERSIYVDLGEGVLGFEISYINSQGESQTAGGQPSAAGDTYSAAYDNVWAGSEATYKISLMGGYNIMESETGTIRPGYSDINIQPVIYEATWRDICPAYLNALGTRPLALSEDDYGQQYTGTAELWPLGGLTMVNSSQGEDDLRISFSITIKTTNTKYDLTSVFNNILINNKDGQIVTGYIADTYSSVLYDYKLTFDPNDTLTATCVVTAVDSITVVTAITITLTSVQTYTKFPGDAGVISTSENGKTIFLYNHSAHGSLYYTGIVDTTSNDIDTTTPTAYSNGIGGYYNISGASLLIGVCEQGECLASPLYWLQI